MHHFGSLRHWCPKECTKSSASFAPYPEHDAVLDVEQDLFLLPVVSDESVQRVTVGHPAN